ncbi:YjbH domain-containing protein [Vogesella sp. DC21W]|uniref:YjbH domain-containing protein n=1 Tax=Vogesella aquatica TaxID=2984206 RepID=A0ABT5IZC8_9NEIS|nr:YjbH domain-containing protein [Vogesella aquatica]MDC7717907.1 YjbH domain-containing protein [Vogesella aquatica]
MRPTPIALSLCCLPFAALASPSLNGQTGLIAMPDARMEVDGTFGMGYSFDRPYSTVWLNSNVLPFMQLNGRFVGIRGTAAFSGQTRIDYGSYKDKVIDLKLALLNEGEYLPAVALGKTDLFGTGLFDGHYVVGSKTVGPVDITLGYGQKKIDGAFGGVKWLLPTSSRAWTVLAEYDAYDYKKQFRANETFAGKRHPGPSLGLQYRWGWLGAQVSKTRDTASINTYVQIPFNEKEYIPKFLEPAPYSSSVRTRPTATQWRDTAAYRQDFLQALHQQDFRAVSMAYDNGVLNLSFTNTRISNIGRSVGRALRTALYFAPLETRVIKVRVNRNDLAVADYEFFDLPRLQDYLAGKASRQQLQDVAFVRYARPEDTTESFDIVSAALDEGLDARLVTDEDGHSLQLKGQDRQLNRYSLSPRVGMYFNDPSGALRYEVNAYGSAQYRPAAGQYIDAGLSQKLVEDISKVKQASNSRLAHVRTDIAEYKRGNNPKLNQLTWTGLYQPAERIYGKLSAGLLENMFGGVAGQLVYYPAGARWMAELSGEAVQQRDYQGWFGRRDYKTVTGLASLHYRLPLGVTVTGRAGRFLAKDSGVRVEVKRRFKSGIEVGAWYTYTDGKDTTNPGSVANPYKDKGIFMAVPLGTMLPSDTLAAVKMSLSPWTRDVGQRTDVPHDLVRILEEPNRELALGDGMGNLGEQDDDPSYNRLPDPAWWPSANGVRSRFAASLASTPALSDTALAVGAGGLILAGVASRDKALDKALARHSNSSMFKAWDKAGSAGPVLALGAAGATMALANDPVLVNTAIISLQSTVAATAGSVLLKNAVNRARPKEAKGDSWAKSKSGDASFPSNHAAAMFAAVTPFAQEYRAPWLYGVAGLAAAGRVAGRKHWASDVAAGSLLGYGTGYWLWKTQRKLNVLPVIAEGGKSVTMAMSMDY